MTSHDESEVYRKCMEFKVKRHFLKKPYVISARRVATYLDGITSFAIQIKVRYAPDVYCTAFIPRETCELIYKGDKEATKYLYNKLDTKVYEMFINEKEAIM